MQELIETQFFCYPKQQGLGLIYTDVSVLKTRLFKSLSLQISPTESFFLRLRKSKIGHYLSYFLNFKKIKINFKKESNSVLGYVSNGKTILFCFDKNNNPVKVYDKKATNFWQENSFLGYTIIEEYTKKNYFSNRENIISALKKRWKEIEKGEKLHGDFTHFNILVAAKNELIFIDEKKVKNSKLFDHFYFYSYYLQCLERCKTISKNDVLEIKTDLQNLIKKICKFNNQAALLPVLNAINTDDAKGLISSKKEEKLLEFRNIFV